MQYVYYVKDYYEDMYGETVYITDTVKDARAFIDRYIDDTDGECDCVIEKHIDYSIMPDFAVPCEEG
jgi:hypothetical protein